MTAPATVPRVGNPKRVLTAEDDDRISEALRNKQRVLRDLEAADYAIRAAVVAAHAHGASIRVLSEFTGMSTNTIMRWKKDAE